METELVMVNRECDKKNKFYNIVGMAEQQILTIIERYDKDLYFSVRR